MSSLNSRLLFGCIVKSISKLIWILTNHISILDLLGKLTFPSFDWICCLLLLQSFQYGLVLNCNLYQLLSSLFSIQRSLVGIQWRRSEKFRFWILHNVWHLFQQNSILSFDLCVTLFHHSLFLSISRQIMRKTKWLWLVLLSNGWFNIPNFLFMEVGLLLLPSFVKQLRWTCREI